MPLIQWRIENLGVAIWRRAGIATSTTSGGLSLTITKPAGTILNDFLLAALFIGSDTNTSQPTITPPSGWTLLRTTVHGVIGFLSIYYLVAGGSEPANYTWSVTATADTNPDMYGSMSAYVNVNPINPIDVDNGQDNNVSVSTYSVPVVSTTSNQGSLLVMTWAGSQ